MRVSKSCLSSVALVGMTLDDLYPDRDPTVLVPADLDRGREQALHHPERYDDGSIHSQRRRHRMVGRGTAHTRPRPVSADRASRGRLLSHWDLQQAAYTADRENRFDVTIDVVGFQFGEQPFK